MAIDVSLEGIRNRIVKSLYGRKFGLLNGPGPKGSTDIDSISLLGGIQGVVHPITTVTSASTASTVVPAYGITLGRTTDSSGTTSGWNLDNPIPGVRKTLQCQTTGYSVFLLNGTANTTVVTGVVCGPTNTTGLTTATQITLWNKGAAAELFGITTAIWGVMLIGGSSLSTYGSSAV